MPSWALAGMAPISFGRQELLRLDVRVSGQN